MNINEMQQLAWENSEVHGFHNGEDKIPFQYVAATKLMLAVSELSESLEEVRDKKPLLYFGEKGKPEGIMAELADVVIRTGDLVGILKTLFPGQALEADLERAIELKMAYNAGRPYMHGKTL